MKMHIKKMLVLLVTAVCLQLSVYASPKHDHQYKKPPFTYWIHTTWESTYIDDYTYIQYKSFRVKYSAPLPYNVTISYNEIYQDTNGNNSNDEYITTGLQGTTETYLGYYQTFYQDLNQNYTSTLDVILNYVQ